MVMNKRGISGVEMVVSFVIFLSFLLFIFIYLRPLTIPVANNLMTNVESAVHANLSKQHAVQPFSIDDTVVKSSRKTCFRIENPFPNGNFFITNKNNNLIPYSVNGNSIDISFLTNETFYYIVDGTEGAQTLQIPTSGCAELTKVTQYALSTPRIVEYFSLTSLKALNKSYNQDYEKLKAELKYPAAADFAMIVMDDKQNEIFTMRKAAPRLNTLTRETPIELFDENTLLVSKNYLRLYTW